ncbi:ATP-binding protein [Streptomyces sp. GSL17-111]|uniref:ATP-binding protein n=1 Tax=Streptomyces sp. GSL17-111 TaxID=3121596 RepID=UPI0030F44E34
MQVLQAQLEIGADPTEVGRARRWARARLAGCGISADGPLGETLILLISELVTNAVVHTGAPAVLRIRLPGAPVGPAASDASTPAGRGGSGAVRVEVADTSAVAPRPRRAADADTGGRGLELVEGLADRWGWQPEGGGKRIWCELDGCPRVVGLAEGDGGTPARQAAHGLPVMAYAHSVPGV